MNTFAYKAFAKEAKTYAAQEALRQQIYDESARVLPGARFLLKGRQVEVIRLSVVYGKDDDAPVQVWYTVAAITAKGVPNSKSDFTVTAEDFERHASRVNTR